MNRYDPRKIPAIPVVRQFTKFAVVGTINFATHLSVYLLLTRPFHLPIAVANPLAFTVAVSVSFLLNRRWTFRVTTGDHRAQYVKFFGVSLAGLGINQAILLSLVHGFGFHDIFAFVLAVGVVMFWNFFVNRHWTFSGHVQG
jgi:putative flippase GtrA